MIPRFCRLALKTCKYITVLETKNCVKFETCTSTCRFVERNYSVQRVIQDPSNTVKDSDNNQDHHAVKSKSKAVDLSPTSEGDRFDIKSVPRETLKNDQDFEFLDSQPLSALDTFTEDVSDFLPTRQPPRTFAYMANRSKLVQELIKLGVKLYKIEKIPKLFQEIRRLNYDADVAPLVQLLLQIGVQHDMIGRVISNAPELLLADRDKMKTTIEFFKVQSFSEELISLMIAKCAHVLLMGPKDISRRMTYLEDKYELTTIETVNLVANAPRLLTASYIDLEKRYITMTDEMEFDKEQIKKLLLQRPSLWTKSTKHLIPIFHFAKDEMKLSNDEILLHNYILGYKIHKLEARYRFLQQLNKAQFDATKPNYISPSAIVQGDDETFCAEVAKCNIRLFFDFIKTL